MGRSARRQIVRPATRRRRRSLALGDHARILVLVIAGIMWFNVLFIGFRTWVAREVRTEPRRAARSFGGGRRPSLH